VVVSNLACQGFRAGAASNHDVCRYPNTPSSADVGVSMRILVKKPSPSDLLTSDCKGVKKLSGRKRV